MGGTVWAESEVGQGSLFQFTVELGLPAGPPQAGTPMTEHLRLLPGERLRVLVAEDNPINQTLAEEILRLLGHSPVVVPDGEAALRALSEESFDVVLMDIQMSGLSGDEAARRIRAGVEGCPLDVPIVALTAHALKGDRERFLAAGMDDYLSKPFDPEGLELVLWRAIERMRGMWTPERDGAERQWGQVHISDKSQGGACWHIGS